MRTELTALLMEGLATYLIHSTVLIALAAGLGALKLVTSGPLKEALWRVALFGALVTTPVQMTGGFTPLFGTLSTPDILPPLAETQTPARTTQAVTPAPEKSAATPAARPANPSGPQTTAPAFGAAEGLVLLWAGFSLALLFRLLVSAGDLRWQLATRETVDSGRAHRIASDLRKRAGLRWLKVSASPSLTTPFTLPGGEIVLPDWALKLPEAKLKAMLAHETAHVARRDPYWVIAAGLVQALFFFQPLNLLARRKLAAMAEYACDEWALTICGSGRALAECIAECAHRYLHGPAGAFGAAMAASRSEVVKRAERLLAGVSEFTRPLSLAARAGAAVLVIAAGFLLPGFAMGEKSEVHASRSSHISIESDGYMTIKISVDRDHGRLTVKGEGRFAFNQAETGMAAMNADSYLDIEETADGTTRRVRFEGTGGGAVSERFWLNGRPVEKDAAMKAWLAEVIPAVYRETGIDAAARTERLYARGGTGEVLDEIALIPSSYTRRVYASTLFAIADFTEAEFARAMDLVSQLGSSYDLRETLIAAVQNVALSGENWAALLEAASHISSSYDLRETLTTSAPHLPETDQAWWAFLAAARGFSSSYDLRVTLTGAAPHMPKTPAVMVAFGEAVEGVTSDYDRRETLSAIADQGGFDQAGWLTLLDAAEGIGSDYDKRETLSAFAAAMPGDPALVARYREVAAGIRSDHDREQAESALAAVVVRR